jgi:hypothetical protein
MFGAKGAVTGFSDENIGGLALLVVAPASTTGTGSEAGVDPNENPLLDKADGTVAFSVNLKAPPDSCALAVDGATKPTGFGGGTALTEETGGAPKENPPVPIAPTVGLELGANPANGFPSFTPRPCEDLAFSMSTPMTAFAPFLLSHPTHS